MKTRHNAEEQGFMLVGLIVAIFLILLALSVAAPRVAKELKRDREVEAVHRGNQYVRGVRQFYLKNGSHYPGSLEQLEKTNNQRFLRQRYADPLTGKPNWRLIHVGEAKTTVKGFFGKPLAGIATSGIGASGIGAGISSSNGIGVTTTPNPVSGSTTSPTSTGTAGAGTDPAASSSTTAGTTSGIGGGSGLGGAQAQPGATTGNSGTPGFGSQSATSFNGTGTPIMGVSSVAAGDSTVVVNEQKTYATWEFIYDPRIEQLKAKSSLLGGTPTTGTSGFGGNPIVPSTNGANTPTTPNSSGTTTSPGGGASPTTGTPTPP